MTCNDWKFKTGKIERLGRKRGLTAGTDCWRGQGICRPFASWIQNWRPAQMTLVEHIVVGSISKWMCEIIFLGFILSVKLDDPNCPFQPQKWRKAARKGVRYPNATKLQFLEPLGPFGNTVRERRNGLFWVLGVRRDRQIDACNHTLLAQTHL